jgi:murein DD-endopeptidase / murein LD-carboxypeptidase
MKLNKLIMIFAAAIFLSACNKNDELLEKLNDNVGLVKKYNEFKSQGVEKEIDFNANIIDNVIDTAFSFIGTPNKYGGIDKTGIDASALVYISISKNSKVQFPRIAQEMARYGEPITNPDKLKRGDIVFFFDTYEINRIITSVGIFIGKGEFIHSSTSDGVKISQIDDPYYWKDKFFYGTRILN